MRNEFTAIIYKEDDRGTGPLDPKFPAPTAGSLHEEVKEDLAAAIEFDA